MGKKLFLLGLLLFLLTGCTPKKQVYQIVYLDVFDTVTTLRGYDVSEKAFHETAEAAHMALLEYHRLFDIYHEYPGGIWEINENAGHSPVSAAPIVISLLEDCRADYERTGGKVNAAMGSVLKLWHEAREAALDNPEDAKLPDPDALAEAAAHIDFDNVIIDTDAGTVFLQDSRQSLDVGAIAKGWAAQKVSETLPEGYLLNLGGNVCARGTKADGKAWVVAVQDPGNEADYLCTVALENKASVTSGDYQRFFTVNGVRYHHIIDPETRMPSEYWRSVTILCEDAGLADCLSTALFLMPLEEGKKLAEECGADAMWVDRNGNVFQTSGFEEALV